jgi:prevent-host-death family protein
MQGARTDEPEPPVRIIGIRELSARADEIVREVRATGRPVDITVDGETVAHLTPSLGQAAQTGSDSGDDRRQAVRDWLVRMDQVASELGAVWPRDVSAQDVIEDVRGPW